MSHGDAWVGVTMPGAVAGLKKFNPARYEALSFANPTPEEQCTAGRGRGRGRGRGGPSNVEQGLQWDMLSQIAAALKSGAPGEPMAGFKVARVFMTTQSGDIVTYINAIHSHARLENGKPAYDGYMIKNPGGAVRIANCAAAPGRNDPRRLVHDVDVPVIGVVAQGEVLANLASRRPDSDNPSGRYRLYEIAGAAHIDKYPYTALPSFADQIAAVGSAQGTPEWPFAAQCDPPIPLSGHPLLKFSYDAAFANLDAWVRKGMPPPHADRIKIEGEGTPQASIALDQFGNAEGGVRSPYVDVPAATYYTTSPGPGTCRELGHDVKFSAERLKMLYGGDRQYAAKVSQSAGRMEKARLITKADEQAMITDLKAK
ncbi:MAG TPA: alpha/beta hydrolase domain-containing protein, partial [Bryobacteraceae bacterium]|nr:alpha/beta hydrolase domain-containing protein [Bryobacteraceae bacterium]